MQRRFICLGPGRCEFFVRSVSNQSRLALFRPFDETLEPVGKAGAWPPVQQIAGERYLRNRMADIAGAEIAADAMVVGAACVKLQYRSSHRENRGRHAAADIDR